MLEFFFLTIPPGIGHMKKHNLPRNFQNLLRQPFTKCGKNMYIMLIISGRVRLSEKHNMIRVVAGYGPEGARNKYKRGRLGVLVIRNYNM